MPSKTVTAHEARLARGDGLKQSLEIIAAGDARNRGGSEEDWAKACQKFAKQDLTAPCGTLLGLEKELCNRIDIVTGGRLGGERIQLDRIERPEETYLAIRGGPNFGRLLAHIRIVVTADPALTLAGVQNSLPTPYTILALATQAKKKADFYLETAPAAEALAAAVAVITEAEKDWAETVELGEAIATSPKAVAEAVDAAVPDNPATEACRDAAAEADGLTSGAATAEATASDSPKPKKRKARPKSKVSISKKGAGK